MPIHSEDGDIGIQRKSAGLRVGAFFAIMLLLGALPNAAFASSQYLIDNSGGFITKIQSTYGEMINIAALLHDYDAKLITAVIVVESEGNEVAVSHKGAKGLMQLMPQTARAMGAKDPKDPFQNILAGTKYLKELERSYGFNNPQEALVAYNMGPSRAKRWLSQYDSMDYAYVQKVMYVYGVLADQEIDQKRIAEAKDAEINAVSEASHIARPLMTKPRNISLASLPFTLPSSRKSELIKEN